MRRPQVSDIVQLASGSVRMTVIAEYTNGEIEVAWMAFESKEVKTFRASKAAFRFADNQPAPRFDYRNDKEVGYR